MAHNSPITELFWTRPDGRPATEIDISASVTDEELLTANRLRSVDVNLIAQAPDHDDNAPTFGAQCRLNVSIVDSEGNPANHDIEEVATPDGEPVLMPWPVDDQNLFRQNSTTYAVRASLDPLEGMYFDAFDVQHSEHPSGVQREISVLYGTGMSRLGLVFRTEAGPGGDAIALDVLTRERGQVQVQTVRGERNEEGVLDVDQLMDALASFQADQARRLGPRAQRALDRIARHREEPDRILRPELLALLGALEAGRFHKNQGIHAINNQALTRPIDRLHGFMRGTLREHLRHALVPEPRAGAGPSITLSGTENGEALARRLAEQLGTGPAAAALDRQMRRFVLGGFSRSVQAVPTLDLDGGLADDDEPDTEEMDGDGDDEQLGAPVAKFEVNLFARRPSAHARRMRGVGSTRETENDQAAPVGGAGFISVGRKIRGSIAMTLAMGANANRDEDGTWIPAVTVRDTGTRAMESVSCADLVDRPVLVEGEVMVNGRWEPDGLPDECQWAIDDSYDLQQIRAAVNHFQRYSDSHRNSGRDHQSKSALQLQGRESPFDVRDDAGTAGVRVAFGAGDERSHEDAAWISEALRDSLRIEEPHRVRLAAIETPTDTAAGPGHELFTDVARAALIEEHGLTEADLATIGEDGVILPNQPVTPDSPARLILRTATDGLREWHVQRIGGSWPGRTTDRVAPRTGLRDDTIITVDCTHPIGVGSKITLPSGLKYSIAAVVPPEEMPCSADGVPIELYVNNSSAPSRTSVADHLALELGHARDAAVRAMAEATGRLVAATSDRADDESLDAVLAELNDDDLTADLALLRQRSSAFTAGRGVSIEDVMLPPDTTLDFVRVWHRLVNGEHALRLHMPAPLTHAALEEIHARLQVERTADVVYANAAARAAGQPLEYPTIAGTLPINVMAQDGRKYERVSGFDAPSDGKTGSFPTGNRFGLLETNLISGLRHVNDALRSLSDTSSVQRVRARLASGETVEAAPASRQADRFMQTLLLAAGMSYDPASRQVRPMTGTEIRAGSASEITGRLAPFDDQGRPQPDSLHDPMIFGNGRHLECDCGLQHAAPAGPCNHCGQAALRIRDQQQRYGHIELPTPVLHPWAVDPDGFGIPKIALLLNIDTSRLQTLAHRGRNNAGETGPEEIRRRLRELERRARAEPGRLREEARFAMAQAAEIANPRSRQYAEEAAEARQAAIEELLAQPGQHPWRPSDLVIDTIPVIHPDVRYGFVPDDDPGRRIPSTIDNAYEGLLGTVERIGTYDNPTAALARSTDTLMLGSGQGRRQQRISIATLVGGKEGAVTQLHIGFRVAASGRATILPASRVMPPGHFETSAGFALKLLEPRIRFILQNVLEYSREHADRALRDGAPEAVSVAQTLGLREAFLVNRSPTLHRPSIQAMHMRVRPDNTDPCIRLPNQTLHGMAGDYDGDRVGVFFLPTEAARLEALAMLGSQTALTSPRNGEALQTPKHSILEALVMGVHQAERPGTWFVQRVREPALALLMRDSIDHSLRTTTPGDRSIRQCATAVRTAMDLVCKAADPTRPELSGQVERAMHGLWEHGSERAQQMGNPLSVDTMLDLSKGIREGLHRARIEPYRQPLPGDADLATRQAWMGATSEYKHEGLRVLNELADDSGRQDQHPLAANPVIRMLATGARLKPSTACALLVAQGHSARHDGSPTSDAGNWPLIEGRNPANIPDQEAAARTTGDSNYNVLGFHGHLTQLLAHVGEQLTIREPDCGVLATEAYPLRALARRISPDAAQRLERDEWVYRGRHRVRLPAHRSSVADTELVPGQPLSRAAKAALQYYANVAAVPPKQRNAAQSAAIGAIPKQIRLQARAPAVAASPSLEGMTAVEPNGREHALTAAELKDLGQRGEDVRVRNLGQCRTPDGACSACAGVTRQERKPPLVGHALGILTAHSACEGVVQKALGRAHAVITKAHERQAPVEVFKQLHDQQSMGSDIELAIKQYDDVRQRHGHRSAAAEVAAGEVVHTAFAQLGDDTVDPRHCRTIAHLLTGPDGFADIYRLAEHASAKGVGSSREPSRVVPQFMVRPGAALPAPTGPAHDAYRDVWPRAHVMANENDLDGLQALPAKELRRRDAKGRSALCEARSARVAAFLIDQGLNPFEPVDERTELGQHTRAIDLIAVNPPAADGGRDPGEIVRHTITSALRSARQAGFSDPLSVPTLADRVAHAHTSGTERARAAGMAG